jgi:hypothetical protein
VRQNSTVLVIHAGNYEYICIRHRETQTLYISDILHIPFLKDPGYGKVQIGIYITALDDALQRIALDETGGAPGTPTGVAGSSPAKEKVPGASEDGHIARVPKATANKRPRKPSRGRSKKRQRTLDVEVSACLLLQTQADRRLSVDTWTGIHSTFSVAPSSLRYIRHS